jgi:hypothetical protein
VYIVKRTKKPPPGNEPPGPPAVHHATSAAPAGNVTGWSKDRKQAKEFTDDEAERVLAYYASRPEAGKIEPERSAGNKDASPSQPGRPGPSEEDMRGAINEIERRGREIRALQQRVDEAAAEAARWKAEAEAARLELDAATAPAAVPNVEPVAESAPAGPATTEPKKGRDRKAGAATGE